ncbi:MAG: Type 1 glutamine amidotransferase-like domain-containing protein [Anaerolineae bacterium]|nr:Type 1 glutamine amidotransferase-like domain-containing protein [Anaerolineae bacterium]
MKPVAVPAPIYLLAGRPGGRRGGADPLLVRALASAGVASPSVAYIGAASDDSRSLFLMLAEHLRACGAGPVTLAPLAGRRTAVDKARVVLEAADVIFVSGGDVVAGMAVLVERQIVPYLRELYEAGKPFVGVSAGSIMLGQQWIRWEDPDDDGSASLLPCMGLAPLTCDTHGEADGWEELRALLRLSPEGTIGYGIPAGGGLLVRPDGALEALGAPVQRFARTARGVVRRADLRPEA